MDKRNWTSSDVEGIGGVKTLSVSELGVVFQPIVELSTGQVFGHEALARCRLAPYSSPAVLFDCAVAEDDCGRLGRLIREVAFAACGDVPLFVNLHPAELSAGWLARPDDPLCAHPRPVFLELPESVAVTHFEQCQSVLSDLGRRTGALLVVDDFGAGQSNLQRVCDLLPAMVKLDLALTREIHRRPRQRAVVRHLVNLCAELGARVVAEGVESVEELACVRDLGVHYAQGFLLARPAALPPSITWPFGTSAPTISHAFPGDDLRQQRQQVPTPAVQRLQRGRPSRRAPSPTSPSAVTLPQGEDSDDSNGDAVAKSQRKPKPPAS